MGGVVQGEFAQGEGGGRRPGGGAADAGAARISRPAGGLACGPMPGRGRNKKRGSSRRDCPFDASIIQRQ